MSRKKRPTVTKEEISRKISHTVNLSTPQVRRVLSAFFEEVSLSLKEGNSVRLRGFGTFEPKVRRSSLVRDFATGERYRSKDKWITVFKPGKELAILPLDSEEEA